jgi:hypothetical protein
LLHLETELCGIAAIYLCTLTTTQQHCDSAETERHHEADDTTNPTTRLHPTVHCRLAPLSGLLSVGC